MLQTGSNLGTGTAAVAKDAADEAAAHSTSNPSKEVCRKHALDSLHADISSRCCLQNPSL